MLIAAWAVEVTLLVSERTPFAIEDVLSLTAIPANVSLSVHAVSDLLALDSDLASDAVLDYSYQPSSFFPVLHDFESAVLIGMYPGSPYSEVQGRVAAQAMADQVISFVSRLNFTKAFLAGTVPKYEECLYTLSHSFGLFEEVVSLHEDLSEQEAEQFVGRMLKPAGRTPAVLLVDQRTGTLLVPLLQKYHIYKEGFAYLVSEEVAWGPTAEGLLYFTDSAAVTATNAVSSEALILSDRLQQLVSCLPFPHQHCIQPSLSLVNIVNGSPQRTKNYDCVFPGNTTVPPKVKKPIISIWAELEGISFDGNLYEPWKRMSRGTILGYAEANQRQDLVPSHQFIPHSVSFGAMRFNRTWAQSQIHNALADPAIAYHGFLLTATILNLYHTFRDLQLDVPMSALSTSPTLSNSTEFPLFFRTMSSSAASALVMIRFFAVFGWKRVAIVYSSGKGDVDFYGRFVNITRQHQVQIVNSESKRRIPLDLTSGQKELNETLWDILNSTVRIIVISHTFSSSIAARLYDFGARPGDYMICLNYGLSYNSFGGSDAISTKARQVMRGAMVFRDHYFGGSKGPHVKAQLQTIDGSNYDPESCVCYDSAMLVAHAVHYMLYKGLLFEQGVELIKAMRAARFRGCMGVVQIDSGSNDIRLWEFGVTNVHLTGGNSTLELVEAAIYSPTRVKQYTILPQLQFPDGSNASFPDSWERDAVCPYIAKEIRDFTAGQMLAMGLCFSCAVFVSSSAVMHACKYEIIKMELMAKREVMSILDGYAFYQFGVEFLQLLALAPNLHLPPALNSALAVLSLNVWEFVLFSQGVYTGMAGISFALISFYLTLLLAMRVTRKEARLRKWLLCKVMRSWAKSLLQPLSTICFFPLVSTLQSAFVCDRATGPAYTDSFLAVDCWERCWSGTHLRLSIVSALLLCLYTPFAVLTRPVWQDLHPSLHIKGSVIGLLSKAVLQLFLIASFVSLRAKYPTVHAVVYLLFTGLYSIWLFFITPYNYERLNLWEKIAMLAVCIYALFGLIKVTFPATPSIWMHISLYSSYLILFLVGATLQCLLSRYHSMLIRTKEDRYDIIKFAFTFGLHAQRHLQLFHAKCKQSKQTMSSGPLFCTVQTPRRVPQTAIQMQVEAVIG